MRRVLTGLLLLVGLVPATLHAAPAPTYASIDARTDLARSYFGARYYASQTGRFTTIDPLLGIEDALVNPQRWNRYMYSLNNPLRYVDPDGRYVTDCAGDDVACQERAKDFEAARQKNLQSRNRSVSEAAAAYGNPDIRNGVTVYLNAEAGTGARVDASLSRPNRPVIRVVIGSDLHGIDLQRAIAHEGVHVSDDFAYINSGFNPKLNPTFGETEFRAFSVGAAVRPYVINTTCSGSPCSFRFGPTDVSTIRDFLRRSDQYGGLYNLRVFP